MHDDFRDEFDRAIATGFANAAVLQLAAAWCQHIGVTKGPRGTGLLEHATGLPITGGSLRCDYAKAPTSFSAVLEHSAVDFYEQNCIGCRDRDPTGAAEHLGTWADARIAEREELRREQEEQVRQAAQARERRRKERRLALGAPDATLQSILDLVDRIDAEARDVEAERLLISHAEMSPGDFPEHLIDHITTESIGIGNDALLESVIAVFDRQGRPATDRMLRVAFEAVGRGVAAAAAGRVIAVHAERCDADDRAWDGIVRLAAGGADNFGRPFRIGAEHAPLIRLYDLDPERTVKCMGARLHDEDVWVRATAAHAAEKLVGERPSAGLLLLPALLDALTLPDNSGYLGDPFASGEVRKIVADVLELNPSSTAREINTRIQTGDAGYARELWGCYHNSSRQRRRRPLSREVAEVIAAQGVALLRQDLDPDLLREVSDTLELLARSHGESLDLRLPDVVALVLSWADRIEAYDASRPTTEAADPSEEAILGSLEWETKRDTLLSARRNVEKILGACAARRSRDYVDLLVKTAWDSSASSRAGRISLLEVLGSVVREQTTLDCAKALLFRALESDRPGERASALRAFAEIGRHEVVLPGELTDSVLAALNDDKLIVVLAAIGALSQIEVPVDRKLGVITCLLHFAEAYGSDRLHTRDVERALHCVLQLARGEGYEERATGVVLEIVGALPSGNSVGLLDRLPVDHHAGWPSAAVRALRLDPDPRYYGVHDYLRQSLLQELADLPTDQLAPWFDELENVGRDRLPHDRTWAWAIADVLAYHQQHERAAVLCDAVVTALPDTREQRPARRFARQVAIGHHLDGAVARGDVEARKQLMQDWAQLAGEEDT
jgi:hypothetical protein